jgi:hypothetical protein
MSPLLYRITRRSRQDDTAILSKLNRKRALFVLTKVDEILAWERKSETERDTRFVELGR